MMQRRQFLIAGAALIALSQVASAAIEDGVLKDMDAKVDKAMAGYNAKNWKAFYAAGWADSMKAMYTEQTFNALYTNNFMKTYGTYKSRKINQKRSTVSASNAVVIYDAEFSMKKGILAVNFMKEGGVWKLQQLQMQAQ